MVETTVHQGKNDQYKTTIPKGLGDSMNLNGKKLEWSVQSKNRLEVVIVDE